MTLSMGLTRRRFLGRAAPLGVLALLPACPELAADEPEATGESDPFLHGVASGDPLSTAVILWTRVSLSSAAGAAARDVAVQWRVALDPAMSQLVAQGEVVTGEAVDYTVKVDVTGLSAGTTYYYDFSVRGARSRVARTRTLATGAVDRARIAVMCCANYPAGFFNAYALVAARADLDLVLHLGDYLYEYGNGSFGDGSAYGRLPSPDREALTLDDYRQRHAQYKRDVDLQEAHRQHPFIAIWDDHEVANNAYRDGAANHQPESEGGWAARKAAAMQAYFEWMPIRASAPGQTERVYRTFSYGDLFDLVLLDTRYERDAKITGSCDPLGLGDPARSLLGSEQEEWLLTALERSSSRGARWRLLGQQVMFGQLSDVAQGCVAQPDQWDGYPFSRQRVLEALSGGIENVVILTGDAHSSWAFDISPDPFDAEQYTPSSGAGSLAVEFVAPGVTSPGPGGVVQELLDTHPHLRFVELERRGYVLLDLTPERAQAEWYFVATVEERRQGEELGSVMWTAQGDNHLSTGDEPSLERDNPPALAP
ncbi:MAG TPA: alkaline phosphatase D family protein [Polyangiaceae bacterium]|nr:alkaline phosphatase D family protein [Polyangiaceae bacterium]